MRYLWQYWRENLRRSFRDWEKSEAILAVIPVIVSLVATWGILQSGFIDAIPEVLGVAFLAWLLVLILFITPARMWNVIRKDKEELEQRLEPKLAIVSGTSHPLIHRWHNTREEICRTFRVCVKNISDGATVHDAKVALVEADPPLEFVPIPLHLMHDNPTSAHMPFKTAFDLDPRGKQYVDVFWCSEDPSKSTIVITCAARGIRNMVPKRRYALTIQATGQDVPDCKERVVIDIGPEGEVLFLPGESCA